MKVKIADGYYRIRWEYHMDETIFGSVSNRPLIKGYTICIIEDADKNKIVEGISYCSMKEKMFDRKIGREKSFAESLKESPFSKEERVNFWKWFYGNISTNRDLSGFWISNGLMV
jgi:hypothetical protein